MDTHRDFRIALLSVFLVGFCFVLPCPVSAQVEGYRFIIPDVEASAGTGVRITVQGENAEAAQGFSFATRYPADVLTIGEVHTRGTILESVGADFFQAKILAGEGILVVGALIDTESPFDGTLIPNIGSPLDFFHIDGTVAENAVGEITLSLEDGLASPPVDNLYSVRNRSFPVEALFQASIPIAVADGGGQAVRFVRGDVNLDSKVDVTDPVAILNYSFRAGPPLPCLVAADANDDDVLDLSDPIYVLSYLFLGGPGLSAPTEAPGTDPTPGYLGCASPMLESGS
jgi:hypothetical protein